MRLSAANDVARLPGITPKNLEDSFGQNFKTPLKHYHRTTQQDFDNVLSVDPFWDSSIARAINQDDAQNDAVTPENDAEWKSTNAKTPRNKRFAEHESAKSDLNGVRSNYENATIVDATLESDAQSDDMRGISLELVDIWAEWDASTRLLIFELAKAGILNEHCDPI